MTLKHLGIAVLGVCTFLAVPSTAGVIGNWSGSSRTLNSSDMATAFSTLTGAGHTVLANSAITAGGLAGINLFWIGEAAASPTAGELSALSSWINGGGILVVLFDSGCGGCTGGNATLAGVGSSMSASGSAVVAPFAGGNFATTGGPFDLVGQTLVTSPGTAINGGTALAGGFLAFESIGSGYLFAFGDRSDHNFANPTAATVNGQLLLNLAEGAGPVTGVPEPATFALLGAGLVSMTLLKRRR